jgi:hypothetical protein
MHGPVINKATMNEAGCKSMRLFFILVIIYSLEYIGIFGFSVYNVPTQSACRYTPTSRMLGSKYRKLNATKCRAAGCRSQK